ncbi:hypothetical protein RQP46_002130 [Phenoliferia psychrophenolica]
MRVGTIPFYVPHYTLYTMRFTAVASVFALFAATPALASASSALASAKQDIDYNPAVTSPTTGDVWTAGQSYDVTWNTVLPSGINLTEVSQTANLVLGYKENGSENLDWVLATSVPLYTTGAYTVTLPKDLESKSTYIIALIGSSGDVSQEFTINPASKSLLGIALSAILGSKSSKAKRNLKLRN